MTKMIENIKQLVWLGFRPMKAAWKVFAQGWSLRYLWFPLIFTSSPALCQFQKLFSLQLMCCQPFKSSTNPSNLATTFLNFNCRLLQAGRSAKKLGLVNQLLVGLLGRSHHCGGGAAWSSTQGAAAFAPTDATSHHKHGSHGGECLVHLTSQSSYSSHGNTFWPQDFLSSSKIMNQRLQRRSKLFWFGRTESW